MCGFKLGMLVETSLEKRIEITDATTKATTQAKKLGTFNCSFPDLTQWKIQSSRTTPKKI
jgi:hypothetical protein